MKEVMVLSAIMRKRLTMRTIIEVMFHTAGVELSYMCTGKYSGFPLLGVMQGGFIITDVSGKSVPSSRVNQAVLALFEPIRWDNVHKRRQVTANPRCLTSQKSEDLKYRHISI